MVLQLFPLFSHEPQGCGDTSLCWAFVCMSWMPCFLLAFFSNCSLCHKRNRSIQKLAKKKQECWEILCSIPQQPHNWMVSPQGLLGVIGHILLWSVISLELERHSCKNLAKVRKERKKENKFKYPRSLGGAYYRREICVSKLAGLIIGGKFVTKFLNVQLVILGFWLEIRNKLITLKMPSSNTIAINFIRTEIQLKGWCSWGSKFMIIVKAHIVWGAPEGVWVQGGRIKLLCKYFVYGLKKFKAWGNSELHKRQ